MTKLIIRDLVLGLYLDKELKNIRHGNKSNL